MTQGENMSGEEIIAQARVWEEQRDYIRAIDKYLDLTKDHTQNFDVLEGAWEQAVNLAMVHDKDRIHEISKIVSKRLREIQRYEQAGELLENIGLFEDAIKTYIIGTLFEKARACNAQVRNQQIHDKLEEMINVNYKKHLVQTEKPEDLAAYGNDKQSVIAGLEMLIKKGDWKRCLEISDKNGDEEIRNMYLMKHAKVNFFFNFFLEIIKRLCNILFFKYFCLFLN